jgi:hypothetical protein
MSVIGNRITGVTGWGIVAPDCTNSYVNGNTIDLASPPPAPGYGGRYYLGSGWRGLWGEAGDTKFGPYDYPTKVHQDDGRVETPKVSTPEVTHLETLNANSQIIVACDKTQLGPELVANGGFDTDAYWEKGVGVTIAGGVAHLDGTATVPARMLTQPCISLPVVGRVVRLTFVVRNYVQGSVRSGCGGYNWSPPIVANGSYEYFFSLVNPGSVRDVFMDWWGGTAPEMDIDDISVKEIIGGDFKVLGRFTRAPRRSTPSTPRRRLASPTSRRQPAWPCTTRAG